MSNDQFYATIQKETYFKTMCDTLLVFCLKDPRPNCADCLMTPLHLQENQLQCNNCSFQWLLMLYCYFWNTTV